jgi:hypothetical protein
MPTRCTYNLTFSHDAEQKYVLIADSTNDKIWIQDRMTGAVANFIGDNGRMVGQFHWMELPWIPTEIFIPVRSIRANGCRNSF